ncbi:MAG: LuxR C-terminal-related transcriptional regulator, partial [Actinomycetota bacterium]
LAERGGGPDRLELRELEVLRMLAAGAGTREIAEALCYSERTVKTLIQEVERELGARSRAQAVAEGIRLGII